jgi:hypothetical protein
MRQGLHYDTRHSESIQLVQLCIQESGVGRYLSGHHHYHKPAAIVLTVPIVTDLWQEIGKLPSGRGIEDNAADTLASLQQPVNDIPGSLRNL